MLQSPRHSSQLLLGDKCCLTRNVQCCSKGKRQGKQPEPGKNGAAWGKTELRPGFVDPGLEEGFQYLEGLMNKMSADKADSPKADMPFLLRASKTLLVVSSIIGRTECTCLTGFLGACSAEYFVMFPDWLGSIALIQATPRKFS